MMEFNDRLKLLINTLYDGNVSKFSREVNVSEGKVRSYYKGVTPSMDFISDVLQKNRNISYEWLLWGDGEMLKQQQAAVTATDRSQVIIGDNNSVDHSNNKKEIVGNNSSTEIDLLKQKIASLERELQQKDETIKAKDETLQAYKQLISKN